MREIGRYCIKKRIEMLQKGEECPQDILTQIITLTQREGVVQMEELLDDFLAFYMAGTV